VLVTVTKSGLDAAQIEDTVIILDVILENQGRIRLHPPYRTSLAARQPGSPDVAASAPRKARPFWPGLSGPACAAASRRP
jgi:hypothetical protein